MPLTYTTNTASDTIELGQKLAQKLKTGDCVLLFGDLGAGKTHFTQGLAKGLGIEEGIKSPTYAYVKKYKMSAPFSPPLGELEGISDDSSFYHYDLYRLNPGDDTSSIGLEDSLADPKSIHAIEWADRLGEEVTIPSVQVTLTTKLDHHEVIIRFEDAQIPSPRDIDVFYKNWQTPMHVRRHMAQVAKVAMKIAQAYADIGFIVNGELLYAAAILHDVARVCDFKTLDRAHFDEEITGGKWMCWVELREQFKGQRHWQIGRDFLTKKGFAKTGQLLYCHASRMIVDAPELLESLEAKILYYADKRVKHDQIVDLAERFRDGRARYGDGNEDTQKLFEEVDRKAFELEKDLFQKLKIGPEGIS